MEFVTELMHVPRLLSAGAVMAVLTRPVLWPEALAAGRRMAPPGWWRSAPRSPLPPANYLRFRQQTNNGGDGTGPLQGHDLVAFLKWCRSNRSSLG